METSQSLSNWGVTGLPEGREQKKGVLKGVMELHSPAGKGAVNLLPGELRLAT